MSHPYPGAHSHLEFHVSSSSQDDPGGALLPLGASLAGASLVAAVALLVFFEP